MAKYTPKNTKFSQLSKRIEDINLIMVGVVIVMFIGFVTLLITTFGIFRDDQAERSATFQELKTQVQEQNSKIDRLTDELRRSNIGIQ